MSLRGVVVNVLDCDTVVSVFEHQSRYYIHFSFEEGMQPPLFPHQIMAFIVPLLSFYKDGFGIE